MQHLSKSREAISTKTPWLLTKFAEFAGDGVYGGADQVAKPLEQHQTQAPHSDAAPQRTQPGRRLDARRQPRISQSRSQGQQTEHLVQTRPFPQRLHRKPRRRRISHRLWIHETVVAGNVPLFKGRAEVKCQVRKFRLFTPIFTKTFF